jgi:aldehyde dehydrogenase (NAD+)
MNDLMLQVREIFKNLEVALPSSGPHHARSPIDGSQLAAWPAHTITQAKGVALRSHEAFIQWRLVPAPQRAAVVRRWGELVRQHKESLGQLISIEVGKIYTEGLGEVQEVVDICDFAQGLARSYAGQIVQSERPGHMLMEQWHPLGPTLTISAFNFPMAVFAWNAALALVCGNTVIWKPSEKTVLSALAMHALLRRAVDECSIKIQGIAELVLGMSDVGGALVSDSRVRCVSATGSTRMGRAVALACAADFKRSILELGGNNAVIVCESADVDQALQSVLFGAAGTAGQRCTTTRRLFVHRSLYAGFVQSLHSGMSKLSIGNPLNEHTRIGPLFEATTFKAMQSALKMARTEGGTVHGGYEIEVKGCEGGTYVMPAIVEMPSQTGPMLEETFAPILYAMPFDTLDEAIALNNAASHGLSSAIFTRNLRESALFIGAAGSDCGIANINAGTSGAEIGGAFGGEKETGGGRESGSDSWKAYMRRSTNTLNYDSGTVLAQGVQF